jgi:hypothetical protein
MKWLFQKISGFFGKKDKKENWIVARRRLPAYGENVLLLCSTGKLHVGFLHDEQEINDFGDTQPWFELQNGCYLTPTHWRPLPSLPENFEKNRLWY